MQVVVMERSPYFTTEEASEYLRYGSPGGILMAVRRGRIRPAGRRGRTMLFRREDLDAMVRRMDSDCEIDRDTPVLEPTDRGHPSGDPRDRAGLVKAFERAINEFSGENESNTPDFILAEYLMCCLEAFEKTSQCRERWFGVALQPGSSSTAVSITDMEDPGGDPEEAT